MSSGKLGLIRDIELRAAIACHSRSFSRYENTVSNVDELSREAVQLLGRHQEFQDPTDVCQRRLKKLQTWRVKMLHPAEVTSL